MKQKHFGIALAAFVLVSLASAFTNQKGSEETKPVLNSWYQYTGGAQSSQSIVLESNYTKVSAPTGCNSDQNICAIFVPGTGTRPDAFTVALEQDLVDARDNHDPQTGYIEMKP